MTPETYLNPAAVIMDNPWGGPLLGAGSAWSSGQPPRHSAQSAGMRCSKKINVKLLGWKRLSMFWRTL